MTWNEEMVFTVADPFDELVVLIVEARVLLSGRTRSSGLRTRFLGCTRPACAGTASSGSPCA
jgi:hypothetical protein